jgi:polar amino acid transport system substrate-binding protein
MKIWLLLLSLALASCASTPWLSPEARSQLAPSGKIRAAINYGNPVLATREAATGELRGTTVDLSKELGRRMDLPVELVGYDTVAKLLAGLKAGEWDVTFLAVDPTRTELAFSAPYMEVEVTYLVRESCGMRDVSDIDRAGLRIAVQGKNAADLFLTRELKHASLVRAANTAAAFDAMKAGSADAFADNRQHLSTVAAANPGYRVVEGRFTTIQQAAAVPAERRASVGALNAFIAEAKASGFVRSAIERSGVRGVVVAR